MAMGRNDTELHPTLSSSLPHSLPTSMPSTLPDLPRATGAITLQNDSPFELILRHTLDMQAKRNEAGDTRSVVLVQGVRLENPERISCGSRPPAIMIDMDSGMSGAPMQAEAFTTASGEMAVMLSELRRAGFTVLWLSDQPVAQAEGIRDNLALNGLVVDGAGDLLLLQRWRQDRKQERRWDAASQFCVLATIGDHDADFDELYAYLKDRNFALSLEPLYNNGWFYLPGTVRDAAP